MNCRICHIDDFVPVIDLGNIYPSDFLDNGKKLIPKPLYVVRCRNCGLVQLYGKVDLDSMYKYHYWYRSSLNSKMLTYLRDIVESVQEFVQLKPGDSVLDIGANDGSMLSYYPNYVIKVGVDPATNLREIAEQKCDFFINDYFSYKALQDKVAGKFKIITSIAMFYDLEEPNQFVYDIEKVLADDGIWVLQYTDLYETLRLNDFTNICHEHVNYYHTEAVIDLLFRYGLAVFHIERNEVNGGSIRLYVGKVGSFRVTNSYFQLLEEERNFLRKYDFQLSEFKSSVETIKKSVTEFLTDNAGQIYALGASTKGNTFLQVCGINNKLINAIGEVSKEKFGLRTVGSDIEIISEKEVLAKQPKYLMVLVWQFREFFEELLAGYIERGGSVIFPLPHPEILTKDGIKYL